MRTIGCILFGALALLFLQWARMIWAASQPSRREVVTIFVRIAIVVGLLALIGCTSRRLWIDDVLLDVRTNTTVAAGTNEPWPRELESGYVLSNGLGLLISNGVVVGIVPLETNLAPWVAASMKRGSNFLTTNPVISMTVKPEAEAGARILGMTVGTVTGIGGAVGATVFAYGLTLFARARRNARNKRPE